MVAKKANKKAKRKTSARRKRPSTRKSSRNWSQRVTKTSDAMTLEKGVFTRKTGRQIALSVKRSAERSRRRKSGAYRSAMSMLTFYANRAGKNLSAAQKKELQTAKTELRKLYAKEPA